MRIYFCRQGLTYIMAILQNELPEDEVLACAPEQVAEAAREADILIPTVSRIGEDALGSMSYRSSGRIPYLINGNLENITGKDWYGYWQDFVRETRDRPQSGRCVMFVVWSLPTSRALRPLRGGR